MEEKKLEKKLNPPCETCGFWKKLFCIMGCKPYVDYVDQQEQIETQYKIEQMLNPQKQDKGSGDYKR